MFIPLDPQRGLTQQIYEFLRQQIESGSLPPGSRLPSTRGLAEKLGVSRNTVLGAFDWLESEGYVEGRGQNGTLVSDTGLNDEGSSNGAKQRKASSRPVAGTGGKKKAKPHRPPPLSRYGRSLSRHGTIYSPYSWPANRAPQFDFRHNVLARDEQSDRAWNTIFRQVLRDTSPIAYASPEVPYLRDQLLRHITETRGVRCRPEQLVILIGSQAAFHIIAQITIEPGDQVALEEAHYLGIRSTLSAHGAELIPIPIDEHGLRPHILAEKAPAAKLVYVVPSHQWPTGAILPYSRRRALLDWAAGQNAYVIENDHNEEYRHAGKPIESLQSLDREDRVFYVGNLLRLRARGLRVGFVVVPLHLVDTFRAGLRLAGAHSSPDDQLALARFIEGGHLDRNNRRVRQRAKLQRNAMARALRNHVGDRAELIVPRGGFHVHASLPGVPVSQVDSLLARAAKEGIGLYPDLPFFLRPRRHLGLIFGFGELSPGKIEEGVHRFAGLL